MNKINKQHKINDEIMDRNRELSEDNLRIIKYYQQTIIDNVDNIIGYIRIEKHIEFLKNLKTTSELVLLQVDELLKVKK